MALERYREVLLALSAMDEQEFYQVSEPVRSAFWGADREYGSELQNVVNPRKGAHVDQLRLYATCNR